MQFLKKLMVGLSLILIGSQVSLKASYIQITPRDRLNRELLDAIDRANEEMVKLAIRNGAEANYVWSNNPALIIAINNFAKNPAEMFGIIDFLLAKGANVNAQDYFGDTALHAAIKLLTTNKTIDNDPRKMELAKMLINTLEDKGASPYQKNRLNKTPYDLLNDAINKNENIAPYLRSIKEKWDDVR